MTITVNANGSSFNFPDGTDAATIQSAMRKHFGGAAGDGKQQPAAPMGWGEVASQAITNAPSSAYNFAKDMVQPIVHPIDTAKGLYNVASGALDQADAATNAALAPIVDPFIPNSLGAEKLPEKTFGERYDHALAAQKGKWGGDEKYSNAVGSYFADRYGSLEAAKKALATDPVGVAGDLSVILTGGGSLAERAPGVLGKVGEVARTAGDILNPVMGPAKAIGAAADEYKRLVKPVTAPTTDALYEAADAAYNHPSIEELIVKPSALKQWKDETVVALNRKGFNAKLSPKSFGIVDELDAAPANSFVSGQNVDTLRRTLKKAAASTDPTEAETARAMISSLDDFLGNIPKDAVLRGDPAKVSEALTEARGNYAAAKRSDVIDDKLERADRQAGSANSGMNIDNATRQRIKDILNSNKLKRGFSKDEIAQMESIVRGTPVQNVSRRLGNMLGGGGGLGTTLVGSVGAAAGASHAGPLGAAVGALAPVIGYAFKKLSAAMSQADVRKLQEIVRSRSPLGRQMQSSVQKFGQASVAATGSPTPQNIARLMLASRNLSSNLTDAGLDATPESIIGALAGPGKGQK